MEKNSLISVTYNNLRLKKSRINKQTSIGPQRTRIYKGILLLNIIYSFIDRYFFVQEGSNKMQLRSQIYQKAFLFTLHKAVPQGTQLLLLPLSQLCLFVTSANSFRLFKVQLCFPFSLGVQFWKPLCCIFKHCSNKCT